MARRWSSARIERGRQRRTRPPEPAGNVATPTFLAERATEIADEHESLEVELLDREAIVERGMGAFAPSRRAATSSRG